MEPFLKVEEEFFLVYLIFTYFFLLLNRTNLPKEIMGLGDIEMRYNFEQSYISSNQVLNFLDHYANLFQLKNLIKFRHYVIRVRPVEKSKWEVSD